MMRARIEEAQRRRATRSLQRTVIGGLLVVAVVAAVFVLRRRPLAATAAGAARPQSEPLRQHSRAAEAAAETDRTTSGRGRQQEVEEAAGGGGATQKGYYYTGEEGDPQERHELMDEPIPAECHVEEAADYGGAGLTWGLTHKARSAAACCAECRERSGPPDLCNVWVWCGDPGGICWTPDIWNHTTGACWLKKQDAWDGSIDLATTNLGVNARGDYPEAFRLEHKGAPAKVPWTAGLVLPKGKT